MGLGKPVNHRPIIYNIYIYKPIIGMVAIPAKMVEWGWFMKSVTTAFLVPQDERLGIVDTRWCPILSEMSLYLDELLGLW